MTSVTRSGRGYRGIEGLENSPLISISRESKEELVGLSPRSVVPLINQCIPLIPPSSTPPTASPASNPSSLTPPPPSRVGMAGAIKLLVLRGIGNEEPKQFWFVVKVVWEAQGVTDENIKKDSLARALQDHALTWYMKYLSDHPNVGIVVIQDALNKEFSWPK